MIKHIAINSLLALGLALSTSSGFAAEKAGTIVVKDAWLRATPKGAAVAGGYATITNTGSTPDTLIAASIPSAGPGDIHVMSMENGVMHMSRLDHGLTIAPGATATLEPGGYHMMFSKPAPLKEKQSVKGSLTFEKAGVVPVTFAVAGMAAKTAPGSTAMEGMDMKGMDMGGMDMKGMGH